ncbi:MAG: tyrosine-protein phosphatase, partial [Acidimicrobiales bacterium]
MTPPERLVTLEGCFNFRDLGGYSGAGGRHVRWRTLFRADGLSWLTAADLEQLGEMGIHTVVDLRTHPELEQHGRFNGGEGEFTYHHFPMIDVLPPAANLVDWVRPAYVADQYMQ